MTGSAEWDLTVPADDAEFLAELRRRGVRPGSHLHVVVSHLGAETTGTGEPAPAFIGSFAGPADLAERSGQILRAEFPPVSR